MFCLNISIVIPEWPPERNWPERLCKKLQQERELGQRLNIIIIAEGAISQDGVAISAEDVKKVELQNL